MVSVYDCGHAVGMRTLLLALAGCSGAGTVTVPDSGTEPSGCADVVPSFVLGTGETAYASLADGDGIEMTNGPQGGWHLWTGGSLTAMGPTLEITGSTVTVTRTATKIGGNGQAQVVDLSDPAFGTWDAVGCSGTFAGVFTFLDDFVPPTGTSTLEIICNLEGEELEFVVDVKDVASGAVASDTRVVRARLDDLNVPACASLGP